MTGAASPSKEASLRDLAERLGRSRSRLTSLLLAGVVAVVLGLVVLTLQLDRAAREARSEAVAALEARAAAEKGFNANARTLLAAKKALRVGDMAELARLLDVALVRAETSAEATSGDVVAPTIAAPAASPGSRMDVSRPDRAFGQRVFLRFAGLIQRSDIAALNQALRGAGWRVEGADGQRTGDAAGFNEVRYGSDEDQAAAEALAVALGDARLGSRPVTTRRLSIVREGVLEVWISRT